MTGETTFFLFLAWIGIREWRAHKLILIKVFKKKNRDEETEKEVAGIVKTQYFGSGPHPERPHGRRGPSRFP
jgi:hypothetical protein